MDKSDTLEQLLAAREPRPLAALPPDARVDLALVSMKAHSAVLVLDRGQLVGLFTHRDAVLRVLEPGRDPRVVRLADVMTPRPVTVRAGDSIAEAIRLMARHEIEHLPVLGRRSRVVGVVDRADLLEVLAPSGVIRRSGVMPTVDAAADDDGTPSQSQG